MTALPRVILVPTNIDLRSDRMYGAFRSGTALMHSGTGPAAAMSYPLGVHYKVPHGFAGGVFMPHVIEHNINEGVFDYGDFYLAETPTPSGDESTARSLLNKMKMLWEELDVPSTLSQFNVSFDWENQFLAQTLELAPALEQNPVPFGAKEIKAIFSKLM